MNNLQKQAALNKLARLQLAISYVQRQRTLQKTAGIEDKAELISKLKAQRDRSLAWDLVSKMGWRGLQGLGIGMGVGGVAGGTLGGVAGGAVGSQVGRVHSGNSTRGAAVGAGVGAGVGALVGAGKGGYYGAGIGGLAGGLESLLTYSDRKQKAIDKLKELGVEDNGLYA